MKAMIALLSLVTLVYANMALAEPRHGTPRLDRLLESLQLDANQATQVKQVLQEQHEKRRTLFETQRQEMRSQMQAMQQETIERLRPILSAEQLQTFVEQTEAARAQNFHRGPQGPRAQ